MLSHAPVHLLSSRRVLAAAFAMLVLTAACHGVPLTAPSGTAITLLASANSLTVNGTADVTAILIEGAQGLPGDNNQPGQRINGVGTPVHNGTVVTFLTTLGRLVPSEATTENGRATVALVGDGQRGVATITAISGGAIQTLEIIIGSTAPGRVILTASPPSLPPTGGTTTIQARVEDVDGNGLPGVSVSFGTSAGTLSAVSVLTDAVGFASTTLTSTETATVSASAGGIAAEPIQVVLRTQ